MTEASIAARWARLPDHTAQVQALREAFLERYGSEPDGVWSAPGRLNLLGEYVDFNGGACFPTPLPYRTLIAGRLRRDGILHAESLQMSEPVQHRVSEITPGTVSGWFSYVGGVAWSMNQEGGGDIALPPDFGADLLIDSTVPVGGGLSSSAALECATALALLELSCPLRTEASMQPLPVGGCGPDNDELRARLARVCMRAENEVAGAVTGGLDQTTSLRSLPGQAIVIDFRDFSIQPVDVNVSDAGLTFLVIDTRAPHDLADGQYSARRDVCEALQNATGVEYLRDLLPEQIGFPDLNAEQAREARERVLEETLERLAADPTVVRRVGVTKLRSWMKHIFTDMMLVERARSLFTDRLPTTAETWAELGSLFTTSHCSMRDDLGASREELDVAVATCLDNGALGARLVGGGFGGAVLALVSQERTGQIAQAVADAFAQRDFEVPVFLPLAPGRPANRDV
ncbi:galactokinase [Kocuria sp. HSID16901]|uniref:galactokinase n=1 Tax=Kocuria sp. HSID16901 TaxID=2419505 RepID=UPI0006604C8A|nr:galactokinase family protein [Kocuria sp. HSID16901]MCT1368063.1 galactokinase [Rothia sp. p3-SID1597]RUQ21669.1 galactokinase [Kocuria sp. HSID16901]